MMKKCRVTMRIAIMCLLMLTGCQSKKDSQINERTEEAVSTEEVAQTDEREETDDKTFDAAYSMAYLDLLADYKGKAGDDRYLGYALLDISNDGIPELLISEIDEEENGSYYGSYGEALYTLKDEKPELLIQANDDEMFYLLEENQIFHFSGFGYSKYYYYIQEVQNGEIKNVTVLCNEYDDEAEEHRYINHYDNGQMGEDQELTEAEWEQEFEKIEAMRVELTAFQKLSADDLRYLSGELWDAYAWVECPSWEYYIRDEEKTLNNQSLHLQELTATENDIIDTEQWFDSNGFDYDHYYLFNGWTSYSDKSLPYELIPYNAGGYALNGELEDDQYVYGLFGEEGDSGSRYVLSVYEKDSLAYVKTFNFLDFRYDPNYVVSDYDFVEESLNWIVYEAGILYVSMGHNTYASSAPGNAYVMAVDFESGELLWKSAPLVSNARNFEVIGSSIVCGYGFTNEPDYLFILDKETGVVQEQISVKTGPDYIIRKGDILYVRTYDMDYTFQIIEN